MFGRSLPPLEIPRLPRMEAARLCGHRSVHYCSEQTVALVIAARDISRTVGREIPGSACLGMAALAILPLVRLDPGGQSALLAARDASDPAGLFSRLQAALAVANGQGRAAAEPCDILYSLVADVGCAFSKWLCKTPWTKFDANDLLSRSPAYWQAAVGLAEAGHVRQGAGLGTCMLRRDHALRRGRVRAVDAPAPRPGRSRRRLGPHARHVPLDGRGELLPVRIPGAG